MHNDKKDTWIQAGYALFAEQGPSALKIEVLAKMVGISKSSFYHYFADLEVFDSSGSIASGNASNALFNVLVLLLAVGPLWRPAQ
jgi:AcrR family transcriptional regulator